MQQNFKSKNKNIYKVEYVVKCHYKNIIIEKLNLQYFRDNTGSWQKKYFYRIIDGINWYNKIPFYHRDEFGYHHIIKYIEINEQLQQLLYSDDQLNRSLGTQIIFNKLGINYE